MYKESYLSHFNIFSVKLNYRTKIFTPYLQYIHIAEYPTLKKFYADGIGIAIGSKIKIFKHLGFETSIVFLSDLADFSSWDYITPFPLLKLSYTTWASDNYKKGEKYDKLTANKNRISMSLLFPQLFGISELKVPEITYDRFIFTRKFVKFFLTGSTLLNFGIGAEFNLTRWMFFSYRLTSSPLYYADNYIISRTSELGFRLSKRITVSTGITLPTIKRKNPIHKYDYEFFFPDLRIGYNF
jgi:hypothetical protein